MGEKYTVYLDIVFTINFFMDFVLLWATAKFSQLRTSWVRLAAGALVGACYSLALLLPALHFLLSFSIKVFFSMLLVAFPRLNLKGLFRPSDILFGGFYYGWLCWEQYICQKEQDLYGNKTNFFFLQKKYTWLVAVVAVASSTRWGRV